MLVEFKIYDRANRRPEEGAPLYVNPALLSAVTPSDNSKNSVLYLLQPGRIEVYGTVAETLETLAMAELEAADAGKTNIVVTMPDGVELKGTASKEQVEALAKAGKSGRGAAA